MFGECEFVRVAGRDMAGAFFSHRLQIVSVTDRFLTGRRVRSDRSQVDRPGVLCVVELEQIVSSLPLRWDERYGSLVVVRL